MYQPPSEMTLTIYWLCVIGDKNWATTTSMENRYIWWGEQCVGGSDELSLCQIGKDRDLGFDPCCVSYFNSGDFALIGGSNKKVGIHSLKLSLSPSTTIFSPASTQASLYSREGVLLAPVHHPPGEDDSWVWCCKPRPDHSYTNVVVSPTENCTYMYIYNR